MTWDAEAKTLKENGMGNTAIADSEMMLMAFPGMDRERRRQKVRELFRDRTAQAKGAAVGVIGDLHQPFTHENYLPFIKDTFKKYGCGSYIFIGDIVDHHAISRFQSETCADSALSEFHKAKENLAAYIKAFPKAKWCLGNHDLRVESQAASLGIDRVFLKPLREIYGIPDSWEVADEFIIDDVLYKHGINAMGKDGVINAAIQERMSTVIGHSHAFAGCKYAANARDIIFGLNVGCAVHVGSYAMAYAKHDKNRPILGCGVVHNSMFADFIPMPMEYFNS